MSTRGGYKMRTIDEGDGVMRRAKVVVHEGFEGYVSRFTQHCSGCTPSYEECGSHQSQGSGCHECGYTGKRVVEFFMPFDVEAFHAHQDKAWAEREAADDDEFERLEGAGGVPPAIASKGGGV